MLCLAGLFGCCLADALYDERRTHIVVPGPAAREVQEAASRVLDQWAIDAKTKEGASASLVERVKVTIYTQVIPDLGYLIGERFRIATLVKRDGKAIQNGNYHQVHSETSLFIDALSYLGCIQLGLAVRRGSFSNTYFLTGFWNGKVPDVNEARQRDSLEDVYDNL